MRASRVRRWSGCRRRNIDVSHGYIMEWDKYEAATLEPRWPSVAAMLTEIADALQHRTDIHGYQPDACDDGTLDWSSDSPTSSPALSCRLVLETSWRSPRTGP
jgi:hypothetical protein